MPFYATYTGHINDGVFTEWEACKREIHKKPKYKKFDTRSDADNFHKNGPFATAATDYDIIVYTDGACRKNGRAGATGGIGIYFGANDVRNVSERIVGRATNNIAEISAVIRAIQLVDKTKKIGIYTDSTYAILCCTTYGDKCAKKGWPVDIPNVELVRNAYELIRLHNITLVHVPAHTGARDEHSIGNHNADQLATACLSASMPVSSSAANKIINIGLRLT